MGHHISVSGRSGGGGGEVVSVTGTANQITASPTTGDVVLTIPSTFIAPGSIRATTTFNGLNGQTITGNSSGAWAIAANGTNQSVTVTPSGTGTGIVQLAATKFVFQEVSGDATMFLLATATAPSSNNFIISNDSATGSTTLNTRVGSAAVIFSQGNSEAARFAGNTGNLLVAITADGTGRIQLPTGTTAAGGVTLGNVNIYQNATNALTLGASAGTTLTGKVTSYNAITTAGWGVLAIQADGNIAGTTNARSAAVATYTVGAADGTFVVSGAINITTSTTFSFSLDVVYTDDGNVSRTLVLPLTQLAGTFVATGLATNILGAGPYESASMTIRAKANTSITIRPSAGGTYTAVVYNVAGNIRQIG